MNKEQHLTYELGITNVPSDVMCDDNGLEESMGMVYADGEHRVIQDFRPYKRMNEGETLLFVHRFGNKNRYIYKTSTKIRWKDDNSHSGDLITDLTQVDALPQITAIGKTLIIGGKTETYYFVGDWTHDRYSTGFTKLPYPDLEFTFGDEVEKDSSWNTEGQIYTNLWFNWNEFDRPAEVPESQEFQNGAIGAFNSNLNKLYHDKCFALPFTIRYALELYNGDYTYISDPIPMFPSYSENSWGWDFGYNDTHLTTKGRKLKVKNNDPINDDWSDVIKGIAIFISPFVNIYDTTSNENVMRPIAVGELVTDKIAMDYSRWNQDYNYNTVTEPPSGDHPSIRFHLLNKRSWDSISYDLMNNGTYYKLCSIKTDEYSGASYDLSAKIDDQKLGNIVTSELLKVDDYYSRTKTYGEFIRTYNERLIMAGLHRNFFDGFKQFIRYEQNSPSPSWYAAVVYIKTDDGERIVRQDYQSKERQGKYFYYPDPRAYKVRIYGISSSGASSGTRLYELNLSEHQALNGAYYMQESDLITHATPGSITENIPNTDTTPEYLSNQLAMSEVNNPFTFYASGYTTVGNGEIKALSTITQALSQGQFGQYPLLIFATDGIWAGSIANTGYISAVHPMSREVISDGTEKALTQTDGAVFFVTAKGLMVVEGNSVKCVSEQLSGKATTSFTELLKSSMIAYDYRDSLLWICPNNTNWCYIYSMKSGTFGKKQYLANSNLAVTNIVNFYPDSLIQIGTEVYSLTSRPDINEDKEDSVFQTYSASLITRAMKLGNGLTLKSIMQMRNICDLNANGSLSVQIYAKNDLNSAWTQLTHLRGTPWKYYQLRYTFSNLIATDRFAGTVLITQERRTNKLR